MTRTAWAILRKDLRIEVRSKESVPAMALFSVTVFVLFHFGLQRNSLEGDLAAGVLWVTLLLATVLGVNRLFVVEREQGGIDGMLLAPIDRTALFVAKASALFLYLLLLELIAVPAFDLLLLGPDPLKPLPALIPLLLLTSAWVSADGGNAVADAMIRRWQQHRGAFPARPAPATVRIPSGEVVEPK